MLRFALILCSIAPLAACGDDDGGPSTTDEDAGRTWMPTDAGIPARQDAGPPPDAGESRVCFELPALTGFPYCTAATRDCVTACPMGDPGNACRDACWAGDPTPPMGDVACGDCVFRQLFACAGDAGCQAEVDAFVCCIVDNCAMSTDPMCIENNCTMALQNVYVCTYTADPTCFELTDGYVGMCYAESDPDGGVPMPDAGGGDAGTASDGGL
jgi:hypothetical protein